MSLPAALRASITDFYFNSWRFAPANLAWGAVLIAALLAGPFTLPGIVLLVALALPTAGLYRLAALVARGEPAMLSDFVDGLRRAMPAALTAGASAIALTVVFVSNIGLGFEADGPAGWFLSAMALWGQVGLSMFLVAFWPILLDPRREGQSVRQRALLAGLVVIGRPGRLLATTAVVLAILVAATFLFAVLILVGVAYAALVSARVVLPTVDELESRLPAGRLPG